MADSHGCLLAFVRPYAAFQLEHEAGVHLPRRGVHQRARGELRRQSYVLSFPPWLFFLVLHACRLAPTCVRTCALLPFGPRMQTPRIVVANS